MANVHTTLVSLFDDIADAIRYKTGGTELIIADTFPDEIRAIPTGGGGGGSSVVSGTFTPAGDLGSISLSDCIGKSSIFVYPTKDITTEGITTKVHWGCLILSGHTMMQGATNAGKTAYAFSSILTPETGQVTNGDTFDSTTGTVSITQTATQTYGGCFTSNMTYGYFAW